MKLAIKLQEPPRVKAKDTIPGHIYRNSSSYYLAVLPCEAIGRPVREENPNHYFFVNLGLCADESNAAPNLAILRGDVLMEQVSEGKITSA